MSAFGGAPLIAGTLTGVRAFGVRESGWLQPAVTGVPHRYTEGENVASCDTFYGSLGRHQVASQACSCGFYAYHPRALVRTYGNPLTISAMVEGYGRVTVGSRGFRAEKMRLLCLINPLGAQLRVALCLLGIPGLGITLMVLFNGWLGGIGAPLPGLGAVLTLALTPQGALVSRKQFRRVRERYPNTPVHFRWYATLKYGGPKPPIGDSTAQREVNGD